LVRNAKVLECDPRSLHKEAEAAAEKDNFRISRMCVDGIEGFTSTGDDIVFQNPWKATWLTCLKQVPVAGGDSLSLFLSPDNSVTNACHVSSGKGMERQRESRFLFYCNLVVA
jgi:hypothetical protein